MAKFLKQNIIQAESVPLGSITYSTSTTLPEGYLRPLGQA